eukprot:scaffold64361_cov71-Cyclotella_meneghiniana.AAC.1
MGLATPPPPGICRTDHSPTQAAGCLFLFPPTRPGVNFYICFLYMCPETMRCSEIIKHTVSTAQGGDGMSRGGTSGFLPLR